MREKGWYSEEVGELEKYCEEMMAISEVAERLGGVRGSCRVEEYLLAEGRADQ